MALSAERDTERRDGIYKEHPVAADAVIYAGGIVDLASGYAVAGADTAGHICAGIALESVDNTGGANGDKYVKVARDGAYLLKNSGLTQADEGKPVYVHDDETVKLSTTNGVTAGVLYEYVSADEVWVYFERVDGRVAAEVAAIADPASATAEDCANKINAVLTALKNAGFMASS